MTLILLRASFSFSVKNSGQRCAAGSLLGIKYVKKAGQGPVDSEPSAEAVVEVGLVGALWPFWGCRVTLRAYEAKPGGSSCREVQDHCGFWFWVLEWGNHSRGKGVVALGAAENPVIGTRGLWLRDPLLTAPLEKQSLWPAPWHS